MFILDMARGEDLLPSPTEEAALGNNKGNKFVSIPWTIDKFIDTNTKFLYGEQHIQK